MPLHFISSLLVQSTVVKDEKMSRQTLRPETDEYLGSENKHSKQARFVCGGRGGI